MSYKNKYIKGILYSYNNTDYEISKILNDEKNTVGVAINLVTEKQMKLLYLSHLEIAEYMNMCKSTWEKCRGIKPKRQISFWEAIVLCIVIELDLNNSIDFLRMCHYTLTPEKYICDRFIFHLLAVKHKSKNTYELNERLEILNTIKKNFYTTPDEFLCAMKNI